MLTRNLAHVPQHCGSHRLIDAHGRLDNQLAADVTLVRQSRCSSVRALSLMRLYFSPLKKLLQPSSFPVVATEITEPFSDAVDNCRFKAAKVRPTWGPSRACCLIESFRFVQSVACDHPLVRIRSRTVCY